MEYAATRIESQDGGLGREGAGRREAKVAPSGGGCFVQGALEGWRLTCCFTLSLHSL